MYCPACRGRLWEVKLKSTVVDVCAKCGGVWFDKGELRSIVDQLIAKEKIKPTETQMLFKKREIAKPDPDEGYRTCPRCDLTMKKLNYAYDSNVIVDKCQGCEGIWTDKGEVKRIAGFLKNDPRVQEIGASFVKNDQAAQDLDDLTGLANMMGSRGAWYVFGPTLLLPLGDDEQTERFPFIMSSIIAACVAIFVGQCLWVSSLGGFFHDYGFLPWQFDSIGAITSMFLHGDVFHLLGNIWFLWIFGKNIEYRFGKIGFPIFYLAAGFSAALLQSFFSSDLSVPMIGASGAISGVMGAYLIFYPTARLNIFWMGRVVRLPAFLYLVGWFVFQLLYGLLSLEVEIGNVAWFAHVGGFVFGMLAAFIKKKYASENIVVGEAVNY